MLSIPSSDIIIIGCTISKNAKIIRKDLVGFLDACFIAVDAKT